ncbi:MAG: prepilin-type N-terminal cleavage/methylation domain-containing protein [Planctomycetes bacterium]|nr:prepilin-type N-terminal cleavage/methylation domain-containing protein [Planctomycetota bacterium]
MKRATFHRSAVAAAARAGFTLVEVLLVLLIMSGIMLAMTSILTAARTSRDTIHNIQETQLAGPAILDRIERDLRGLSVYDRTRMHQLRVKDRVLLGLDADSLDFVTATRSLSYHLEDDRYLRAPLNEVGYRLKVSADGQFLEVYRRESYGVDEEPFEGGTFLLLHERVRGFDLRCIEKDGPDEEPVQEWGADENSENVGLPARLELSLTLELAPRLVNEALRIAPTDKRTITYKRVIRFSEGVRFAEEDIPVPRVPKLPSGGSGQQPQAGGGAGGANPFPSGGGGGGGGGDPFRSEGTRVGGNGGGGGANRPPQ